MFMSITYEYLRTTTRSAVLCISEGVVEKEIILHKNVLLSLATMRDVKNVALPEKVILLVYSLCGLK